MDDTTNTIINIAGGCFLGGVGGVLGYNTALLLAVANPIGGAILGAMILAGLPLTAAAENNQL